MNINKRIPFLKSYFESHDDVLMAFLFGSAAKGTSCKESDIDIGIYLKPKNKAIEVEEIKAKYKSEDEIWSDVERILKKEVDLIILNRASVCIADTAIRGTPIIIKDRKTYLNFMLRVTHIAEGFRDFIEDYWQLKQKMKMS